MNNNLLILILTLSLCSNSGFTQKEFEKKYHKEYYSDGNIKCEGWKKEGNKVDYWHFYYPNGTIAEKGHFTANKKTGYWYFYSADAKLLKEGHFRNNKAEKWWIIYDIASKIIRKYQYQNDIKNGYCLVYKKNVLFKAEKYVNNKKTGEWTDIFSFKKDNPNASL